MKGIGVKGARQKNSLWSLGGFEGLACGAGLVNGEGLRGTGSLDRFVVKGSAGSVCEGRLRGTCSWWGLRGTSPAHAGNVGTGRAFARPRDGDQGVDVPTLAPARSRCRLVVRAGVGPTYLHKRGHSLLY